ncbi:MAG: acetolactate synthase 3 regulatory subunit domain protein [Alphaproteobacteria bacterium]|nr:acetolactate synthase 3 regulatory subunit domain protein [Alphaproteobacteria bacterium]
MTDTIQILIDRADGSLQRLIGLIERRGFQIDRMTIADAGAHRDVRVSVSPRDPTRCMDVLGRQIDRLVGVRRIHAAAAQMSAPAAPRVETEAVSCTA